MINQEERQRPFSYLKKSLEYFYQRSGKIIVEIGSMRMDLNHDMNNFSFPCCNDGHSSVILVSDAEEFYTVDIDKTTSDLAIRNLTKFGLIKKSNVINGDGLEFLRIFTKPIDLLFLDAWDVGTPNYAENHLEAYNIAKKSLHDKSIILIDDCDVIEENGELFIDNSGLSGKGKLVIPEAVKDGFKVVLSGRQVLLMKD